MEYIIKQILEGFKLLLSLDYEVFNIVILSVIVSISATVISSLIGLPLGILISTTDFKGKRAIERIIYTFMSTPPVLVGLLVALFISRRGPLGSFGLMFTPLAMIIAQSILIFPIIIGVTASGVKRNLDEIKQLGFTLGGNKFDIIKLIIFENKSNIYISVISGFSRAISEVGAVMIVGGNISGSTRVMTTYIALSNSMGNYAQSISIGIILLLIAFSVNSIGLKVSNR